ncbi:uncharacterized protein IWZ02DRAFT_490145 [Phyllosticta citriasiana]|uniref:Uncharacterized protein n=1 Tax=Phyllosticta citriasiana TaxID=595635 RepID=A0ABR1KRI6_9PEZI
MRWAWWYFEYWATSRLLRSAAFHRWVHKVYRAVYRLKDGPSVEELGGTKIDRPSPLKQFFKHFAAEIRAQLRNQTSKK